MDNYDRSINSCSCKLAIPAIPRKIFFLKSKQTKQQRGVCSFCKIHLAGEGQSKGLKRMSLHKSLPLAVGHPAVYPAALTPRPFQHLSFTIS